MTTYEITFNEKTNVGKSLIAFLEQNKKYIKLKDPTEMTKEEFEAKLKRSEEQYKRGEYVIYDDDFRKNVMGLD